TTAWSITASVSLPDAPLAKRCHQPNAAGEIAGPALRRTTNGSPRSKTDGAMSVVGTSLVRPLCISVRAFPHCHRRHGQQQEFHVLPRGLRPNVLQVHSNPFGKGHLRAPFHLPNAG